MTAANILIVEDENIVAKDIRNSLERLGYNVVGQAAEGNRAFELAMETEPDLVLMDIMLKGDVSGIEVANRIREELDIPIIYLTAYTDETTISRAKVTQPFGYIVKPFTEVDLQTSVEIALYKFGEDQKVRHERDQFFSLVGGKEKPDMIFAKSHAKLVKILTKDIYFVEALKDYVTIHLKEEKLTLHTTMKEVAGKLPESDFMRVHRSYIVRLDHIARIENPHIYLDDNKGIVPIGGSYKDTLIERLTTV